MIISNLSDMKGGWFVGNFIPTAYKTDQFEVSYKVHTKGEKWDTHYHKTVTEINLLVSGEMTIQERKLKSGDIFIIPPFEIADPIFHEECHIVCVKTPSAQDKVVIKL